MLKASIDIGSNSVLLLAADYNPNSQETIKEILNLSFITSLGKDLDKTKKFHPDSMQSTYEALLCFKNELKKININSSDVLVTATEASRVATNAKDFYIKIKNELGFTVKLISSEGEAYYTAKGVASGIGYCESELVIMDIGGASTELIRIQLNPFEISSTISLPVGSVRATDWRNEGSFDEKITHLLDQNFSNYSTSSLVCVAGSMTSLAAMFIRLDVYDDKKIDGLFIDYLDFKKFSEGLQGIASEKLIEEFPHLGKRAPMVAAGARVAQLIGEKLNIKNMKISTRGLRYGTLMESEINDKYIIY